MYTNNKSIVLVSVFIVLFLGRHIVFYGVANTLLALGEKNMSGNLFALSGRSAISTIRSGSYYQMSKILENRRDYKRSLKSALNSVKVIPKYHQAVNQAGRMYGVLQDYKNAELMFLSAISFSENKEYYLGLAASYFHANKYDKAEATIDKVITKFPNSVEGYLYLGALHLQEKDYKKAITVYEKISSFGKDFEYLSYNIRGEIYVRLNDPQKAIEFLNKSIKIYNFYPSDYYAMGQAYKLLGDKEKAITNFKKSLEQSEYIVRKGIAIPLGEMSPDDKEKSFFDLASKELEDLGVK
jgi:tetratricopeptide (TPR) repeat protein